MTEAAVLSEPAPQLATLADLPFHVAGRFPRPALIGRCREGGIDWLSTAEFFDRVRDLSLGLAAMGLQRGERVVIMSETRPEWIVADLAILTAGGVSVPIYPTLSAVQAQYLAQDSGARYAFVSSRDQAAKLQQVRHALPALEVIILFEPHDQTGGSMLGIEEVAARGHARLVAEWGAAREFKERARTIDPGDLATIIYTSGTTGEPKGVMLTHRNIIANVRSCHHVLPMSPADIGLSFLPLSHAFERTVAYICLSQGVSIAYAEGVDTLARDLRLARPTLMTGVPRVFEKFQSRVLEGVAEQPAIKRRLFLWAKQLGERRARALRARRAPPPRGVLDAIAERLVYSQVRARMGGRLKYLVSGSAPLAPQVGEFFYAIGIPIVEGYGLTETAPVLTVNPLAAPRFGTVGPAIPEVEIRIADDGEILARGPNIMTGYYNKPEATRAVLDPDGWFHTGDIGELDADGFLRITDRKKDLIVTSGGKKLAPQPIETRMKEHPLVAECVLIGERRRYPALLIVPDFAALERRLKDLGRHADEDRETLVGRPDVVALYQELVDGLNRGLAQFEKIKKIALLPREFGISTGELTPTMKVRRRTVEDTWRAVIEGLYQEG
ncbi:MAG TPA: AMP-dependent synthetase/ligase [Vicinamibacterales bacterium]|nr:AMP-dependent synthetase/ligase [Vicinamibacterales bacterium]